MCTIIEEQPRITLAMKKIFYVWLFLPLIAIAQSNQPLQTADSLWQVWQDETQSDSIRLKALDTFSLNNIGFLYLQQGNYNSALLFSRRALNMAKEVGAVSQTRDTARSLWEIHKNSGNYKQGLEMHELYIMMRDSILSEENVKEVIRQEFQYAYEKQAVADSVANARAAELKNAQIAQQQAELKAKRNQQYGLFIGLALMFILAGNAYYRVQSKKKANEILQKTLADLRSTQTQLIQQEKLASLGQLTAGIAHEIKNPLNFVNNFSEVSIEMIDEAFDELAKVKTQHAASQEEVIQLEAIQETETILNDIKSNLTKIHEHGSRANNIVSSMLMHSRGGSGKMEPTDLNALIKEYVNLSFHGMRAGKNPINVEIKLDLDDSVGKIALIEEDFSRVLLNLCNNAFDAMREKTKTDPGYKPLLSISTKQKEKAVEIAITSNGPGIPEEIKNKIFQPFFTTKPTGQGTSLGLSLSYDIVKAHGGELSVRTPLEKVETKTARAGSDGERAGSTFIIQLPMKNGEL
jgi:signal transduction histidine kinase